MQIKLSRIKKITSKHLTISGSKSESNRLLILQALFGNIFIENVSNADDTVLMKKALQSCENTINIEHSGTAMRFLTAYFSIQSNREIILTGSERMKQRPIGILVDALRKIGADIEYLERDYFPPLKIRGKKLLGNNVSVPANVSSQYISALMLIAPKLQNGLTITLEETITSKPYIEMTLALLNQIGIQTSFVKNSIKINFYDNLNKPININVESDWSSASYFYSIVALSQINTEITLSSFRKNSLQADRILVELYEKLGVRTIFNENDSMTLKKIKKSDLKPQNIDLSNSPDIAQTFAVTCFGLNIDCHLSGLHTLKIKETNRLEALKNELEKLGGIIKITDNSFCLKSNNTILNSKSISTYQDHRMAMAFAPLVLKTDLIIENAEVVSKSYPNFWMDLKTIGF